MFTAPRLRLRSDAKVARPVKSAAARLASPRGASARMAVSSALPSPPTAVSRTLLSAVVPETVSA